MTAYRHIHFECADSIGRITLNRPDVLNSFNLEMARELQDALGHAARRDDVRALLLTGAGRAFCAGQDLAAVPLERGELPELGATVRAQYNPIIRAIRNIEVPVVCAVNGIAAGAGASVALACDIVLASSEAVFVLSFCKIGLVPDSGATFFLPRLTGLARAAGLMLLGEKVTATQARDWGLIWDICEPAQLPERAEYLATALAALPTKALGLIKRALDASLGNGLDAQLEIEADLQTAAGRTEDFLEGVRAFREKRKPNFKGH
jgi:2-(1,2-epoxy-1,2-dihydrophenyl)acetyl-CoA isomerase